MALTPETLTRHELVGLPVCVVESTAPSRVGIEGHVLEETTRTLLIETWYSGVKRVPKAGTTFRFTLTDETAVCRKDAGSVSQPAAVAGTVGEGTASVTVDGDVLLSRPARRTEQGVANQWR